MRLHTSATLADVIEAARRARVTFDRCTEHRSQSAARAFDVTLFGASTRRPNSGKRGAATGWEDNYAATWDQWGVFLGHLYRVDPAMRCYAYAAGDDYDWKTDGRFAAGGPFDETPGIWQPSVRWSPETDCAHRWEFAGIPREQECARCDSVRRWS
jgi:hypothetical protein